MRRPSYLCLIAGLAACVGVEHLGCGTFAADEGGPDGGGADAPLDAPMGDAALGDSAAGDAALGDAAVDDAALSDAALGDADAQACPGGADCERVVFVTSTTTKGDLGFLAGADAICTDLAKVATAPRVKGRVFRAWLSTATISAKSRLVQGTKPYVLSDGTTIVASRFTSLAGGTLAATIDRDENGMQVSGGVWTNTTISGDIRSALDCDGWSTLAFMPHGWKGDVGNTVSSWTDVTDEPCDNLHHLYCIEK